MTIPMIIDTDPGVDDAVALMLAAASPEARLLAVTTVFGNAEVEVTTGNALRLRALAGLGALPVGAGAARPLVYPRRPRANCWHGSDGLGGRSDLLPAPDGPAHPLGAVTLMAGLLRDALRPVTLVAIGPLTNIALLLAVHPELRSRIERIVAMGGDLSWPGSGCTSVEFNIGSDPEAARRVLVEEDLPTTLVPLDLTRRAVVDRAWLSELAAAGPRCATLAAIIEALAEQRRKPVTLHDPVAVLEAAVPGTLRTTPISLRVVCDHGADRGSVGQHTGGRVVQVASEADLASITGTILRRLRCLR
ncbi:MAG TPA: nucleoside hydrolase [Pseudonocardiaceae bacterium]|nr:nucleoside hydrolase [Pseudonocardiaceae bacterium]